VRAVSQIVGEKVDFAVMPQYKSILPLLQYQPYIDRAFVIEEWLILHSNHGDQPWLPQKDMAVACGYERIWHLGYRGHPGMSGQPNMSLVDFIAWQQGIRFVVNPIPFITVPPLETVKEIYNGEYSNGCVAMAFNEMYVDLKLRFVERLKKRMPNMMFLEPSKTTWAGAAWQIGTSIAYVGDRSALHVIAHGVGQRLLTYEPHPARHKDGHLGTVFGCPYGRETAIPFGCSPENAAELVANQLNAMEMEEKTA